MKKHLTFIVEEMPDEASECPFSLWKPYPPFIEQPGYYTCKNGGNCTIQNGYCSHMKTIDMVLKIDGGSE